MLAPLPLYALLPFVALLLAIALLPLAWPHWWEPNRNKLLVSAFLGLPVLLLYLVREPAALVHTAGDYASFIILLAGLYVTAGGIQLRGDLEATPAVNTAFLGAGALLASLIGTVPDTVAPSAGAVIAEVGGVESLEALSGGRNQIAVDGDERLPAASNAWT